MTSVVPFALGFSNWQLVIVVVVFVVLGFWVFVRWVFPWLLMKRVEKESRRLIDEFSSLVNDGVE